MGRQRVSFTVSAYASRHNTEQDHMDDEQWAQFRQDVIDLACEYETRGLEIWGVLMSVPIMWNPQPHHWNGYTWMCLRCGTHWIDPCRCYCCLPRQDSSKEQAVGKRYDSR